MSRNVNFTPTAFYALTMILASLAGLLTWWFAVHNHRLVDPNLDKSQIWRAASVPLATIAIFLLSIAVNSMSIALIVIIIAVLVVLLILGYHFLRPAMLHWGTKPLEISTPLAGDELISEPLLLSTRAISIIPELQALKIGDLVPFWQGAGVKVIKVEPFSLLALGGTIYADTATTASNMGGTWVFALQEMKPGVTRLLIRTRVAKFPPPWLSILLCRLLIEQAHFIMERGMLYGIRKRAETGTLLS